MKLGTKYSKYYGRQRPVSVIQCDSASCVNIYLRRDTDYNSKTPDYCSTKCRSTKVTKVCAECGISFKRRASNTSKSGLYFCTRPCKDKGQKHIKEIQPDHYGTSDGSYKYRQKELEHYGTECTRCGYKESIYAIDVHHRDRDRENNSLSNLEVLCCNCHAIEHRSNSN